MSKSITIPFKLPFAQKLLKRVASFFNIEIIEKVTGTETPGTKISATSYIHTIPQQAIDAWHAERRKKDQIQSFQDEPGFHMKGAREGYIYYVDSLGRVCEVHYEMLVGPEYDMGLYVAQLNEWFYPIKKSLSESEKAEIIAALKIWLAESRIKAYFNGYADT